MKNTDGVPVEAIVAARNALLNKPGSEGKVAEIDKFFGLVGFAGKVVCQKCVRVFHRFHDCQLNPVEYP